MSLLDTLGQLGLGSLGGYLSGGGFGSALTGGLTSSLLNSNRPLTLGNALTGGLEGAGAGLLYKPLSSGISSLFGGGQQMPLGGPGQNFPGGGQDSPLSQGGSSGGFFSNLFGGLGNVGSKGLDFLKSGISGLGGLGGALGGLFGGGGQQSGAGGTSSGGGAPGSTGGGPGGGQAGSANFGNGLGLLGGGGALLAGLLTNPDQVDVSGAYNQQLAALPGQLSAQTGFEKAAQDAQRNQFLQDTANTRTSLQNLFSPANLQAQLSANLQPELQRLGGQGLLSGPGGGLDSALARQSAILSSQYLPTLAGLETGQLQGLSNQGATNLASGLSLSRGGLDRQFNIEDAMRNATLSQALAQSQQQANKRRALLQLGGGLLGNSIYGQQGSNLGQVLAGVL